MRMGSSFCRYAVIQDGKHKGIYHSLPEAREAFEAFELTQGGLELVATWVRSYQLVIASKGD